MRFYFTFFTDYEGNNADSHRYTPTKTVAKGVFYSTFPLNVGFWLLNLTSLNGRLYSIQCRVAHSFYFIKY